MKWSELKSLVEQNRTSDNWDPEILRYDEWHYVPIERVVIGPEYYETYQGTPPELQTPENDECHSAVHVGEVGLI